MLAFLLLALLYMWLNTTTQGKKKTMYSLNAYNVRSNCYSHSKHTHTHPPRCIVCQTTSP